MTMAEKIAPVQGYAAGIPWSMHLRAYDAYCKKYGRQEALIDLEGRGCRGGFGVGELDDFIPGWREEVSEINRLKAEIASKSEQIGKLYKVCNERDVLKNALASLAYLEVENLGSKAESGRPAKYFECKLCHDWNDELRHIEHADGCPLHVALRDRRT